MAVGALVVAALALLVWRRGPVAPWAAWTLLMLLPFILLTEKLTLVQPMEPSRYLYMASAIGLTRADGMPAHESGQ